MTIQTIELAGRRFVILPEEEFRELQHSLKAAKADNLEPVSPKPRFAPVHPLKVSGIPASEMLIQDRR